MTPERAEQLRAFARENYKPGDPIPVFWDEVIIREAEVMNQEKKALEIARIREVVANTADLDAAMTGRISFWVKFDGSLQKNKKLTAEEKKLVMTLPEGVKTSIGGDKPLFVSKEYDSLMSWIETRRSEFKRLGIPNTRMDSSVVIAITSIPEMEALAEKTERELPEQVAKLIAVYPEQIAAAKEALGPLHNPGDYRPVEAVAELFRFSYDWYGHGALEALKQTNIAYYKKAMEKAALAWAEIEANGVLVLRQTFADIIAACVDSLTNKETGEKKKFYPARVTNIVQFIDDLKKRNICNDKELDRMAEELRGLVTGLDLKAMSSDIALREAVKAKLEPALATMNSMVISAKERRIVLK